jgi:hypothetical protein
MEEKLRKVRGKIEGLLPVLDFGDEVGMRVRNPRTNLEGNDTRQWPLADSVYFLQQKVLSQRPKGGSMWRYTSQRKVNAETCKMELRLMS